MFDMPCSWKEVPKNDWVWILRDRMEHAHALVRRYAEGAMLRQKHYHDMKMSYERFNRGEDVYVYFPQRKAGCSPKFTSYWRGPFKVVAKISEVLYKVNCGRNGKEQVVHCDRMKTCKAQTLRGEEEMQVFTDDAEKLPDEQLEAETVYENQPQIEVTDELAGDSNLRPTRDRRVPVWMKDYVPE